MAGRTSTSGVLLAFVTLGLAVACAGASFESSDNEGGSGGDGAVGGTSGTSGKGGSTGKGGSSTKGGSGGGTGMTGGTGGTGGTTARGGKGGTGGGGGTSGTSGTSGTAGDAGDAGTSAVGGTSGTSGTSGSANGGTSGTTGSYPCVTGGECPNEGAQCSESECCSCSHTCDNGKWSIGLCPPCAARICPDAPPADGDACDCSNPDQCVWDQCSDGPRYTGACVDGHWQMTVDDSCVVGGACCTGNGDCADHHCVEGVCKDDDPRGCWGDDQCEGDTECSGVWVCPCNADCDGYDEPGSCVAKEADCCLDDGDCTDGAMCLRGVCKAPDPSGCWSDRECVGGTCEGEVVCACDETCFAPDSPGLCVVPL